MYTAWVLVDTNCFVQGSFCYCTLLRHISVVILTNNTFYVIMRTRTLRYWIGKMKKEREDLRCRWIENSYALFNRCLDLTVRCVSTMVDFSNRRPSFNCDRNRPQTFMKWNCIFLAKKSLGTVHLIPWVCPKLIKLLMYFKLPIHVMKVLFKKCQIIPVLEPRMF